VPLKLSTGHCSSDKRYPKYSIDQQLVYDLISAAHSSTSAVYTSWELSEFKEMLILSRGSFTLHNKSCVSSTQIAIVSRALHALHVLMTIAARAMRHL
jgi:hypothetical protein